ncbi:MAG: sugar ABC transporter permease, partial [Bacilli bacterium]|nr:sugar ABC transporter permease [Bacilli bacterium]
MDNVENKKTPLIKEDSKLKQLFFKVRNRYRKNETLQYYVLMAPFLILFLTFTVFPVIMSIFYSLTNFNMLEQPDFVFLDNYKRLFLDDEVFLIAVKNTIVIAVITEPISYMLAFLIAWLINELPSKLRVFFTL